MHRNTKLRWLRILGWSLAGLAAGWTVSFFLPQSYTSEATMQIVSSAISRDFLPHESVDVENLLKSERPVVLSRNVITNIINSFDLYKSERKRLPMEDVVENEFRKSVHIDSPGANLIRVAFTYRDRLLANKVTQDLTSKFISGSGTLRSSMTIQATQFFQDEVDEIGKSWSKLNAKVKATPTSDPGYEILTLQRDQVRKEYESMAQKLGTAKVFQDLTSRGQDMRVELLDSASLPQKPDEAHTGILLLGLACGLGTGFLAARRSNRAGRDPRTREFENGDEVLPPA